MILLGRKIRGYPCKLDPKQSRGAAGSELFAKRRDLRSKSNEKMFIRWKERALVGARRLARFREDSNGVWANDKE